MEGLSEHRNFKKAFDRTINMMKFMSGEEVKQKRKGRGKDKGERKHEEAVLRKEVVRELRKRQCWVKRLENSICGDLGVDIPDLFVFNNNIKRAGFIELKTLTGTLSPGQERFRDSCIICGVNHWVCRSVEEVINAICKHYI